MAAADWRGRSNRSGAALPSTGDTVIGINLKVFKYQSPEHVDLRRQVKQALRSRRNTIEVGGTSYTVLTGADGVTSFSNSEGKIVYKSQEEFERSFGSKVHRELQLRVKHVDNDSGVFWAVPVNDDFCCDEMSFNRSSRSVVASGESAQHRWRPMRSAEEEQQEEQQQRRQQRRQQQQQQEEEEPEQCERNPLCTRGYKHGGKGGKCSVPREVEEETEEKEDEHSDDVASIAPEEALRQAAAAGLELEKSERSASGYKGVYPSGPRFVASVMQGTQKYHLGTFATAEEAALAYARARAASADGDNDNDDESDDEVEEELDSQAALRTAKAEGLTLEASDRSSTGYKGVYEQGSRFQAKDPGGVEYVGIYSSAEMAALALARAKVGAEAAAAAESQDDASDGDSEEEVTEPCDKNPTRCTRRSGLHFEHRQQQKRSFDQVHSAMADILGRADAEKEAYFVAQWQEQRPKPKTDKEIAHAAFALANETEQRFAHLNELRRHRSTLETAVRAMEAASSDAAAGLAAYEKAEATAKKQRRP